MAQPVDPVRQRWEKHYKANEVAFRLVLRHFEEMTDDLRDLGVPKDVLLVHCNCLKSIIEEEMDIESRSCCEVYGRFMHEDMDKAINLHEQVKASERGMEVG